MSGLQLAIAAGMLIGIGLTIVIWWFIPAQPHLGDALARLNPSRLEELAAASDSDGSLRDRLGLRVQRSVPPRLLRVPTRELALLQIPVHRYLGEKAMYGLIGLAFPTVLATTWTMIALAGAPIGTPPLVFPVGVGLLLGIAMSFIPDYNAHDEGTKARSEFAIHVGAYLDGVGTLRELGTGPTQSMETAAGPGDSWVFRRLREELNRARLSGVAPWESLKTVAEELRLPELADLADTMRLAGEQGATVTNTLRARARGIRTALLNAEHAKANNATEGLTLPVSALAMVLIIFLVAPAFLKILGS